MHRVGRVVIAAIDELADAAPRDVAQVVDLAGRRPAQPAHRVEQHAFAQRRLASTVNEPTPNVSATVARIERPGDDDVGASARRARAPSLAPPRCGGSTSSGDHVVEVVGGELEAVVGAQRFGAGAGVHHPGHRLGRSRRGDGDVEAELADVPVEVLDEAADVVAARLDAPSVTVAAREEAVGEAHGAELEAAGGQRLAALADSSSVDPPPTSTSSSRRSNTGTACSTPRWIRPRFLDPGDHLDVARRPPSGARSMNSWALTASRSRWSRRRGRPRRTRRRCPSSACRQADATVDRVGVSIFMSPPPEPRRTISRSGSASRSRRRRPGGRRRGGCCSCRCRAPRAPWRSRVGHGHRSAADQPWMSA